VHQQTCKVRQEASYVAAATTGVEEGERMCYWIAME
jgi:hypothetical protein